MSMAHLIGLSMALSVGCGPRLSIAVISAHPPITREVERPQVVRQSGDKPDWVCGEVSSRTHAGLALVGLGTAPTLEEARGVALQDLSQAMARYIAADVEFEFEAIATSERRGERVVEHQTVHHAVHARQAVSPIVESSGEYWEVVRDRQGGPEVYRYYVRLTLPNGPQ